MSEDPATQFMQRLGRHKRAFEAHSWPRNILSILCAEVLELKAEVAALKAQRETDDQPTGAPGQEGG